mmetsp:Transcript_21502/g.52958  ORF Transcript_21502/g.52958 Transcript_21502/m.52958 type:complete len:113 (-) Transcript_21502:75-413(-)
MGWVSRTERADGTEGGGWHQGILDGTEGSGHNRGGWKAPRGVEGTEGGRWSCKWRQRRGDNGVKEEATWWTGGMAVLGTVNGVEEEATQLMLAYGGSEMRRHVFVELRDGNG